MLNDSLLAVGRNSTRWSPGFAERSKRPIQLTNCKCSSSTYRQTRHILTVDRTPILQSRPLTALVAPLLRADAKSYTTAQDFTQRNSTFFLTKLDRPPYMPSSSRSSKDNSPTPTIPIAALHTAAAALCFVPDSHWTLDTHRYNISSYDVSSAVSSPQSSNTPEETEKTRIVADKAFKKELYHYLRWALSAGAPGPGIPETMEILGRAETVRRLQEARELTTSMVEPKRPVQGSGQEQNQDRSWMGSLASRA